MLSLMHSAIIGDIAGLRRNIENVLLSDYPEKDPMMWVVFSGKPDTYEMVELLLSAGACARSSEAILFTTATNYFPTMKILLDAGADSNAITNEANDTLIIKATHHNNCDGVRLLIDMGADLNFKNIRNQTVLDIARYEDDQPILNLVIARLVLAEVRRRRFLKFKAIHNWTSLKSLGSPTSNSMFYNMGLALKTPKTLNEIRADAPNTTEQNHRFYTLGVENA
jgi:hypothetical protein